MPARNRRPLAALAALAGLVAMAVLVAVPSTQCLACAASLGSSDQTLTQLFASREAAFYWGAYAELVALFLFVWFLAHLHGELRRIAPGGLATVALVGGTLFGVGVMTQIVFSLAAATVAEGGGAATARFVFAAAYNFAFVLAAPVAALVGATSVAIVRTRWLPRPLGWAGFVVVALALAWITPGIGAVAGMTWIAALGACLAVPALRATTAHGAPATTPGADEP